MEDIGFFERLIIKAFGKNYKTTVPGTVATICAPVLALDQVIAHPALHTAAAVCGAVLAVATGAIGIASKANNVTGAGNATRVVKTK